MENYSKTRRINKNKLNRDGHGEGREHCRFRE